ncbi:MAG: universal stress protein, partial [Acetobacteraceae bacterium]
MSAIRRILVAIKDPWARSLPAVSKAAQLAQALDAELQLFHARSEPLYVDVTQANGHDLAQLEHMGLTKPSRRLEALARRMQTRSVEVSWKVDWDFPAYEAVIRAARRFKADLIVAERHLTA